MYPENPEGAQAVVDSMKVGYVSDTARDSNSQPVVMLREFATVYDEWGLFKPPKLHLHQCLQFTLNLVHYAGLIFSFCGINCRIRSVWGE